MNSVIVLMFRDNQGRKYVAAGMVGPLRDIDGGPGEMLLHETERAGLDIRLTDYTVVTDAVVLDEPQLGKLESKP